jgi:hypothetical protein
MKRRLITLVLLSMVLASAFVFTRALGQDPSTQPSNTPAATQNATGPTTGPATMPAVVHDKRYGNGVCEVHKRKMDTAEIPGDRETGYFRRNREYREYAAARERLFPHAGLDYPPLDPTKDRYLIYVCPDCVAAREEWKRSRRN